MANTGPDNLGVAMVKDFLSVLDLSPADLIRLLDLARQMKADRRLGRHAPTAVALAGSHVAMLFEKPSLRTRSTFEIAVKELGAETLHVPSEFADGTREAVAHVDEVIIFVQWHRIQCRIIGALSDLRRGREGFGKKAWKSESG